MKLEGIVLRTIRYKESSAIAHVITNEYGLISIMCQGIYRNKRWLIPPALETMSITNFVLRSGRNMYYLEDIEDTKRMDILSISKRAFLSAHIVSELILKVAESNYILNNIYQLTKTYLKYLTESNAYLLTSAWIFKYMSFMGYKPYITDKEENLYLCRDGILSFDELDCFGKIFKIKKNDRDMIRTIINSKFEMLKEYNYDGIIDFAVNYAILNAELNVINSYELLKKWRIYG